MAELTPKEVATKKKRIVNPDKSVSTEKTITVKFDKFFFNIPTIVNGKQLKEDEAVKIALKNKLKGLKRFASQEEAVKAAKKRSADIGREIEQQKLNKLK